MTGRLKSFETEAETRIREAEEIRRQAHESKMKDLQSDTDLLVHTLHAVQRKLKSLEGPVIHSYAMP